MLSDEQIEMMWWRYADTAEAGKRRISFARAIEAATRREIASEIAKWYASEGWKLDEDDVPVAIIELLEQPEAALAGKGE